MKILQIIFLLLFFTFSVQAQNEDFNVGEEIELLRQDIADLENEISEADDPDEISELKKELAMLNNSLSMLQKNKPSLMAVEATVNQKGGINQFTVPDKNNTRINNVPVDIKNNKAIDEHVKSTAKEVDKIISPEIRSRGLQLSQTVKGMKTDSVTNGDLAVGFWIMGNPLMGLYLQSLACQENPQRVDWLNNYASMLTMMGGEEYALPILQRLNNDFPDDAITLNNLGVAWYGLGDLEKAEKFLDKAIMFPGNHSQAKFTKCLIEEKKGNKGKAADLVKESLEEGYSQDKLNHLEKMGNNPDGTYIKGTDELKDEYLGLQQFINLIPAYPRSSTDLEKADIEWSSFKEKLETKEIELIQKVEAFEPTLKASMEKFKQGQMEFRISFSPFAKKYIAKNLTTLILPTLEEAQIKPSLIFDEFKPDFTEMDAKRQKLIEYLKKDISGEEQCRAISEYILYANEVWNNYNNQVVRFWKRTINTMAQYSKYYLSPTPETYQTIIMGLQKSFISTLHGLNYESWSGVNCIVQPDLSKNSDPLPLFEDIKCDRHSEMYIPVVGIRIVTDCHYMESSFDPYIPLPVELKIKLKDDISTGQHVGGSVTVGASQSIVPEGLRKITDGLKEIDRLELGPGKIDVEMSGSTTIEWDSQGISDISANVEINSQLGLSEDIPGVPPITIIGGSQTISLLSGPSTQFKSFFE